MEVLRFCKNSILSKCKVSQIVYKVDDKDDEEDVVKDELEDKEVELDVLEEAMSKLTASDQLFLELYYTNGLSIREISVIVEKTEKEVKTGLSRVRKRLSEIIGTKYGEN